MVHDLKTVRQEIFEEEQVLNVIRVLPTQPEHWKNVKLVMTHSEHMKTFVEIQSHLKIEKERLRTVSSSSGLLLVNGIDEETIRAIAVGNIKRCLTLFKGLDLKLVFPTNKKAKGNGEKNMAQVKCCNCGKKGHYCS